MFGVSDHPVCGGAKVGFADIFLVPQPPLLTRRGIVLGKQIGIDGSLSFRPKYGMIKPFTSIPAFASIAAAFDTSTKKGGHRPPAAARFKFRNGLLIS